MLTSVPSVVANVNQPRAGSVFEDGSRIRLDDVIYKVTTNSDLVVQRRIVVHGHKFSSFHDSDDPQNRKKWLLHYKCTLSPRSSSEIKAEKKFIRPRGTWTITATVRSKGEAKLLYTFTLNWPSMWAAKGYKSFTFGFESQTQAIQWHRVFSELLNELKMRGKGSQAGSDSITDYGASASRSSPPGSLDPSKAAAQRLLNQLTPDSSVAGSTSDGPIFGNATEEAKASTPQAQDTGRQSATAIPHASTRSGGGSGHRRGSLSFQDSDDRPSETSGAMRGGLNTGGVGGMSLKSMATGIRGSPEADDVDSDSDDSDSEGSQSAQQGQGIQHEQLQERWVPYRQANGLAIYYHVAQSEDSNVGGEYMVSAIVRASPKQVLDVLMHGTTNTTILGPARTLEVLECSRVDDNTTKELVRLVLEAPGWAGVFCAAREVIVERMCKIEENRAYVVMFNSSDDLQLKAKECAPCKLLYGSGKSRQQPDPVQGPVPPPSMQQRQLQVAAGGQSMRRSIWRAPVPCRVNGAYTISAPRKSSLASSSECLITCMVKVDLGGACASNSFSGMFCDVFGWRDAFLERILMNVTLVRDEVEYRRFKIQPKELMAAAQQSTQSAAQHGVLVGDEAPVPGAPTARVRFGNNNKSMTMAKGRTAVTFGTGNLSLSGAASGPLVSPISSMRKGSGVDSMGSGALDAGMEDTKLGTKRKSRANDIPRISDTGDFLSPESPFEAGDVAAEIAGVAGPGGEMLPPEGGVGYLDYELMASLSTLDRKVWSGLHVEGADAPFVVRGPTYLKDKKKIPAGNVQFAFAAMDVIEVPHPIQHVARFLPSIRSSGVPFAIIINLIIPGNPLLGIVATYATEQHPKHVLCNPPSDPMEEGHNWQPFDFVMHKFYYGDTETRNKMLKLIPHIADGSWVIKSSVGTTPVILGKALKTTYHETPQYIEIDIDISANSVASYVTGLVRGATKSLVIDMGFVLEGTTPWELPENLLGTLRLNRLDIRNAKKIDVTQEIPLKPPLYTQQALPEDYDETEAQEARNDAAGGGMDILLPQVSISAATGLNGTSQPTTPSKGGIAAVLPPRDLRLMNSVGRTSGHHRSASRDSYMNNAPALQVELPSMARSSSMAHTTGGAAAAVLLPSVSTDTSTSSSAQQAPGQLLVSHSSVPNAVNLATKSRSLHSAAHSPGATTTFGMRHRGHTRTGSNVDAALAHAASVHQGSNGGVGGPNSAKDLSSTL